MLEVWAGSANSWDCDEMGHMNVRVYVEKAMEGLGVLSHHIDMGHAFRPKAPSTLLPYEQHIRFMKEVRPGRPVSMRACVLDHGEDEVVVYQEMRHADGAPAAAYRTRLLHVDATTGKRFSWSKRTRDGLERLRDTPPKQTAPRSIEWPGERLPADKATLSAALEIGAPRIGLGAVPESHVDPHGRMRPEWVMGRISDSVPNLLAGWRDRVARRREGARTGAAVLEYRLAYRRWPRVGDPFEIRTGLGRAGEKTHSLVHWMTDPRGGEAWATSEAVAVTFDLETRKIIPTETEQIAELEALAPRGLAV